jgi:hypothetical protein
MLFLIERLGLGSFSLSLSMIHKPGKAFSPVQQLQSLNCPYFAGFSAV